MGSFGETSPVAGGSSRRFRPADLPGRGGRRVDPSSGPSIPVRFSRAPGRRSSSRERPSPPARPVRSRRWPDLRRPGAAKPGYAQRAADRRDQYAHGLDQPDVGLGARDLLEGTDAEERPEGGDHVVGPLRQRQVGEEARGTRPLRVCATVPMRRTSPKDPSHAPSVLPMIQLRATASSLSFTSGNSTLPERRPLEGPLLRTLLRYPVESSPIPGPTGTPGEGERRGLARARATRVCPFAAFLRLSSRTRTTRRPRARSSGGPCAPPRTPRTPPRSPCA